jgi:hypothetical protein
MDNINLLGSYVSRNVFPVRYVQTYIVELCFNSFISNQNYSDSIS